MGADFLFMDDNARPHRANIVDECLQSVDITRMDWPAYSPDLNPIEHVWDMLGRRIAARQPCPPCLTELRRALLDEWCNIPQDQIDNLILSMPRHCKACIASSGRHTPSNHHTNHVPSSSRAVEFWAFEPRSATFNPLYPIHWKHLPYPLSPLVELSCVPVSLNQSPLICSVDLSYW
ncbi:DDE_3 domain-containing protein [Trichonephila clavipes]|nr:DDE_3 domain-containing protein [Trichonephila clavipes]